MYLKFVFGRRSPAPSILPLVPLALLPIALGAVGCGSSASGSEQLTVLGASSLTEAFEGYGEGFEPPVRFSFAGSDELAAQVRQGAPADVFASADAAYPAELHREGLARAPVDFARNRLVVIADPSGPVHSLEDLAKPGTKLVIAQKGVPAGDYAREVLERLPAAEGTAILGNVRSEETEVTSVAAKVATGAADAGFAYVTDAKAAPQSLRTVAIPKRLEPEVTYSVAVLEGSGSPEAAERFVEGLLHGPGERALRQAGFLAPP